MENKEDLEKKAKEFIKLKIIGKFQAEGFNPIQIGGVEEYLPAINYLIRKGYFVEGKTFGAKEKTVKSIRYFPTSECIDWASSE
jgi:hypothetical protein